MKRDLERVGKEGISVEWVRAGRLNFEKLRKKQQAGHVYETVKTQNNSPPNSGKQLRRVAAHVRGCGLAERRAAGCSPGRPCCHLLAVLGERGSFQGVACGSADFFRLCFPGSAVCEKVFFFEDSIAAPGELSAEEFLAQSLQLKPLDDLYLGYHRSKGGHLRYQAHLIKHSCVVHCAMAKIMNLLQEMKKVLKTTHALALEELLGWRKSREAVFANALPSQYFLGPLA